MQYKTMWMLFDPSTWDGKTAFKAITTVINPHWSMSNENQPCKMLWVMPNYKL